MQGQLWIVAAPSGGGKTSLIAEAVRVLDDVVESVSFTTRPPRPQEIEGTHYFFTDQETFKRKIAEGDFLEYAIVFNNFYGTSAAKVDDWLAQGKDVILNIDWQGARQVMEKRSEVRSIFLLPPSLETLRGRLTERGQDHFEVVEKRMNEAQEQISHYQEFEYVIVNDDFQTAAKMLQNIILAARAERKRCEEDLQELLKVLMK